MSKSSSMLDHVPVPTRRRALGALVLSVTLPLFPGFVTAQAGPGPVRLWREGDPGTRMFLRARVLGGDGEPLPDVQVQLWQADGNGDYQPDRYRAQITTGPRGGFSLDTVLPGQYHGTKHIHLILSREGRATLTRRILFRGDPNLRPGDESEAIVLEEVNRDGERVLVGEVEMVMTASGGG